MAIKAAVSRRFLDDRIDHKPSNPHQTY
jgi:hypothetical protein